MSIIDIQGTGDIKMGAGVPQIIKYEVVYKILQGLMAQGKLDFSIDLVAAEKICHVAVQTALLPVIGFNIKETVNPDFSYTLSLPVLVGQDIIYAMEQKN